MPLESPDHLPEDLDELDEMVARAYAQGVDQGKKVGKSELREGIIEFLSRQFKISKGRRRRADPEDPKTAAILAIWEKLNEKFKDGTL